MKQERLAALHYCGVSYDIESHRVQAGLKAPPPVCGSLAQWRLADQRIAGLLVDKEAALDALIRLLENDGVIIVGQNISFDFLVMAVYAARTRGVNLMPLIFGAYRAHRVFDIGIAEQLHAIARGTLRSDPRTGGDLRDPLTGEVKVGYRLSVLVDLVLGRADAKLNDQWRESYALLEHVPLDQWPFEARQYPVDDACNTFEVALAQIGVLPSVRVHEWRGDLCRRCGCSYRTLASSGTRGDAMRCVAKAANLNLHNLAEQVYADWAMHLGAAWGFVVDPAAIAELDAEQLLNGASGELTERGLEMRTYVDAGILRSDGSEDQAVLKRMTALAYGCTGAHVACNGTGKIVTKWSVREPKRPLAEKNCPECSATGLDLNSSAMVPMTEPSTKFPCGQVQTSRDALSESGSELLMNYAHFTETKKIGTVYLPWLKEGLDGAGRPIPLTLYPHVLLETGRTSYSRVVQLLPRKGSVRNCIKARDARYVTVDVPDDYQLQPGEEVVAC